MKENKMNLKESFKLKLPDTYVSLIENNMDNPEELNVSHFMPVESELMSVFDWEASLEGYEFWNEVHLYLIGLTNELPSIPIYMDYKPSEVMYAESSIHIMNISNTGVCVKYDCPIQEGWSSINEDLKEKVLALLN
jgi:hypothetical protein